MSPVSLLLIARNPALRERWHRWLEAEGWSVIEAPDPRILTHLPRGRAGSVLLDAALLKETDMPMVREISAARIPVIVFGEGADASADHVAHLLREGADDFIPSSIQEELLLAKLKAHLRRIIPDLERTVLYSPRRRIKADVSKRLCWVRGEHGRWDATAPLTETEHHLLCLFLANPETPLDRAVILEELWGDSAGEVYSATLTQHMTSLRKKLGPEGEDIRTLYGRGYMLVEAA